MHLPVSRVVPATWWTVPASAAAGSADTRPEPVLGGERAASLTLSVKYASRFVWTLHTDGASPGVMSPP